MVAVALVAGAIVAVACTSKTAEPATLLPDTATVIPVAGTTAAPSERPAAQPTAVPGATPAATSAAVEKPAPEPDATTVATVVVTPETAADATAVPTKPPATQPTAVPGAAPVATIVVKPETPAGVTPTATPPGGPAATPVPPDPLPPLVLGGMDHAIAGFVVDAQTEAPLEGVRVKITPGDAAAVTDEFGFYRVDGLAPGDYAVGAAINGYLSSTERVRTETWTRLDFSLSAVGASRAQEFFDVFGRVSDRNTVLPIKGAKVRIRGGAVDLTVESDEAGRYGFTSLPAGTYTFEVSKRDRSGSATHKPVSEQFALQSHQAKEVFLKAIPASVFGLVTGSRPGDTFPFPKTLCH